MGMSRGRRLEARAVSNQLHDHSTEQLGALAANLAKRGAVTESISLFRALLKYPPRPRSTDGTIPGSPDTPPDEHSVAHVLRKHLPSLIQHAGISLMPVLDMLGEVIDSIEEWHARADDGARTYLSFERKAIDPHKDRARQYRSVLYDLLIDQAVVVEEKGRTDRVSLGHCGAKSSSEEPCCYTGWRSIFSADSQNERTF